MARSSRGQDREQRLARERARAFEARQAVHAHRVRRRRRDNYTAVGVLVVVATLATVAQIFYFTSGPGAPEPTPSASPTPSPSASAEAGQNVGDVPPPATAEAREWTGELVLNEVPLAITLDGAAAPQGVASIVQDIRSGYFEGRTCHRLVDSGTVGLIQCGSEDGTGASSPDYSFGPIENAPADGVYPAGTIALARGDTEYSQGHQFFITFADSQLGDSSGLGYTVIGRVTSGLDALQAQIVAGGLTAGTSETDGSPVVPTTITSATIQ